MNNIKQEIEELKSRIAVIEKELLSGELPFEISPKISERELLFDDAIEYCNFLGNGWRLPTKDELDQIYNSENDFEKSWYWSSTEYNRGFAWFQNFATGDKDYHVNKIYGLYRVRPIRDI